MTKVYCASVIYHQKAFQSSMDTFLRHPLIIPQVDQVFDDEDSFNICEKLSGGIKRFEKPKEVKKGNKQKSVARKKSEVKKKKLAKPTNMTASSANPYEGHEICFDVDGKYKEKILHHFQMDQLPCESLQVICNKQYVFGVVGSHAKKGSNLYTVNWNFTGLKPMNIADVFLIPSMLLAQEVRQKMKNEANMMNMTPFLSEVEDDNIGDPIGSDVEAEDDECIEDKDDACQI